MSQLNPRWSTAYTTAVQRRLISDHDSDLGKSGKEGNGVTGSYNKKTRLALESLPSPQRQELLRRAQIDVQQQHTTVTPHFQIPAASIDPSLMAIFDIKTKTIRLPNGNSYSAGSGLEGKAEDIPNGGVTPRGTWLINMPDQHNIPLRKGGYDTTDALVMTATDDVDTHGRKNFLVHRAHTQSKQSLGCIVLADADAQKLFDARLCGEFTSIYVSPDAQNDPALAKKLAFTKNSRVASIANPLSPSAF